MIDHMAAKVAAIGFSAAGAAVAVAGVAGDHVEVIQIVAGGTAAVIGATWATLAAFDSRMDTKIKASERRTIAQVHHLRDLLVERGVIHSHTAPPGTEEQVRLEYHTADRDNYGDRHYRIPDMVVIHTAEGSLHSAVNWFQDPESRVSAHYVVGRDGLVVACVPEGNCAWHAGNREVNWRSIGIECEGEADKAETWTAELLASLTELCADLAIRHRIPVMRTNNGPGFAGHCDVPDPRDPARRGGVNHKTDPGPWFPWPTFLDSVQSRVNAAADMAAVPAGPGEENSA